MPRRRLLAMGITIGAVTASLLGLSPAAYASPGSFTAASIHGGGAGAVGAEAVGAITWYNRSVTLTSIRFYVAAGECGHFEVTAWQGSQKIDGSKSPTQCSGSAGKWVPYNDLPLDASGVSGGITEVVIDAWDDTHNGWGWADCSRSDSSCST
jgi:hypothetical protein